MNTLIITIHVLAAIFLVILVLLQKGKGADAGAGFGAGASGTVFGASGSSNFLSKVTAVLATIFFATSLTLGFFANQGEAPTSLMQTDNVIQNNDQSIDNSITDGNPVLPPIE
jgi:preprotein translocase subunit SecG